MAANEYPYWKKNLAMLWASQLVVLAGFQALGPFIPLFMEQNLGVSSQSELAYSVAMFTFFGSLAYCIFNPIWGRLSDRFGAKPMLIRGTFVTAFLFPLMAYAASPRWLIFLRFLTAACAGTTAASNMLIVRNTPNCRQGFALGFLSTAIWGGAMLGNVFCGLIIHYWGFRVSFWLCGIAYLIAGVFVLFTHEDRNGLLKPAATQRRWTWKELFPRLSFATWGVLALFVLVGFIRSFESPYIAMKIQEITGKEQAAYWTGIVSAFVCCGAVIAGAGIGYLSDRYPPNKLLPPIFLVSSAALLLQGVADNLLLFGAARTLLYIAAGGLPPVVQKFLSTVTPPRKRGAAFGLASSTNGIGIMAASGISGFVVAWTGCDGVFYITALFFLIVLPLFVYSVRRLSVRPAFSRPAGKYRSA